MESLTIGKLAKLTGVNTETIRFYERRGLIPRPATSAKGYRKYAERDVARLVFIRRCVRLGFTLDDVQQLLNAHRDRKKIRSIDLDHVVKQISSRIVDLEHLFEVISEIHSNATNEPDSEGGVLEKLMRYPRWREGPEAGETGY